MLLAWPAMPWWLHVGLLLAAWAAPFIWRVRMLDNYHRPVKTTSKNHPAARTTISIDTQ